MVVFSSMLVSPLSAQESCSSQLTLTLDVYTATTAVLVERFLNAREGTSEKKQDSRITWNAAIDVLKSYSVVADSAKKCMAALEVLSEKLSLQDQEDQTAVSQNEEAWDPELFFEMSNLLGEQTQVLPFGMDDFLWLE